MIDQSLSLPFAILVLLPFHITNQNRKAFIFNKMKEIIKKYKNEVPHGCLSVRGRCRKGFIVPIRWHPFNNLRIKNIIYTSKYVTIAYYFIMYYNTEEQISVRKYYILHKVNRIYCCLHLV